MPDPGSSGAELRPIWGRPVKGRFGADPGPARCGSGRGVGPGPIRRRSGADLRYEADQTPVRGRSGVDPRPICGRSGADLDRDPGPMCGRSKADAGRIRGQIRGQIRGRSTNNASSFLATKTSFALAKQIFENGLGWLGCGDGPDPARLRAWGGGSYDFWRRKVLPINAVGEGRGWRFVRPEGGIRIRGEGTSLSAINAVGGRTMTSRREILAPIFMPSESRATMLLEVVVAATIAAEIAVARATPIVLALIP